MAFDGRDYLDASPVYPSAYHSKAPLTGPALGRVLRIAYMYARRHGQLVICQNYPLNFRNTASTLSHSVEDHSTFSRVAEGFRYVPDQATHLVAQIVFMVWDPNDSTSAYHRIRVTGGGNTDNGSSTELALQNQVATRGVIVDTSFGPGGIGIGPPFEYDTYRSRCEVALTNVSAGQDCEIYVEGYAADRSGSPGRSYTPIVVTAWWEVRG
jgi:hypothetical protein